MGLVIFYGLSKGFTLLELFLLFDVYVLADDKYSDNILGVDVVGPLYFDNAL